MGGRRCIEDIREELYEVLEIQTDSVALGPNPMIQTFDTASLQKRYENAETRDAIFLTFDKIFSRVSCDSCSMVHDFPCEDVDLSFSGGSCGISCSVVGRIQNSNVSR